MIVEPIEVVKTPLYEDTVTSISDPIAQKAIRRRETRFQVGLMGTCDPVGNGVLEAKVDVGAGYRIYLKQRGKKYIILLCVGDKSSQKSDIVRAKKLAEQY
ncbi:type II toxin-antitoxin system RelE/ParE family toxin [Gluconobacter sp. OJB]|uniref:type II toxin-antitoxin system RelE/ParE family toxin n=1 Tax=Gluconobacter sp. OJB TaxID=3145196 RepID=UPI0031F7B42B